MHGHLNVKIAQSVELLRHKMKKLGHRAFHSGKGTHTYLFLRYLIVLGFTQSPIRLRKKHKIMQSKSKLHKQGDGMKGKTKWVTKGDTNSKECADSNKQNKESKFVCFVDRESLCNLVNKTHFVHNLFLVYLSISTCFWRLCAHHQEKQLCSCDTWYCMYPYRIRSTKCRILLMMGTYSPEICTD